MSRRVRELERHLEAIEHHLAAARELLLELGQSQGEPLAATYDYLDRGERRRDAWLRRGIVFALIAQRGGAVDEGEFDEIVRTAGYRNRRAGNRFFTGEPEPVLESVGGAVRLTERGRTGADFFLNWWLPRVELKPG